MKQYDGKKLEWIRAIINAWLEEAPDGEISGWADETFTTFRKLNAPRTDEEETKHRKMGDKKSDKNGDKKGDKKGIEK